MLRTNFLLFPIALSDAVLVHTYGDTCTLPEHHVRIPVLPKGSSIPTEEHTKTIIISKNEMKKRKHESKKEVAEGRKIVFNRCYSFNTIKGLKQ
jgi:hypothetical protein